MADGGDTGVCDRLRCALADLRPGPPGVLAAAGPAAAKAVGSMWKGDDAFHMAGVGVMFRKGGGGGGNGRKFAGLLKSFHCGVLADPDACWLAGSWFCSGCCPGRP